LAVIKALFYNFITVSFKGFLFRIEYAYAKLGKFIRKSK